MFRLQAKNHADAVVAFWSKLVKDEDCHTFPSAALHIPFWSKKPVAGLSIKTSFYLLMDAEAELQIAQQHEKPSAHWLCDA